MQFACNPNVFGLAEPAEAPDILPAWPNIDIARRIVQLAGPRWSSASTADAARASTVSTLDLLYVDI